MQHFSYLYIMEIIKITKKAENQIKRIFSSNYSNKSLRIKVIGGGCSGLSYSMNFDDAKEKDNIIKIDNKINLLIDPKSSIYLKDVLLDYSDGLSGKGFIFQNPNATNTCGCGESFSI